MFHLTQNHLEPAIADLNAAIALDPRTPTPTKLAALPSLSQKYDEAMAAFNKAIELAPDSPAAYTHRARSPRDQGRRPRRG